LITGITSTIIKHDDKNPLEDNQKIATAPFKQNQTEISIASN
jgi:hypothetical protein